MARRIFFVILSAAALIIVSCAKDNASAPTPRQPDNTPVNTPTVTFTHENTALPTITGTMPDTFTPTETGTITETSTITATITETPTITETATRTSTFTATQTWTATHTVTATFTHTATITNTMTPMPGSAWTTHYGTAFGYRSDHAAIAYDGRLWITGGMNLSDVFRDVLSSSNGTDWETVTGNAAFGEIRGHSMVNYDGKMWVIGGHNYSTGFSNEVWYSTDGVDWIAATRNAEFSGRLLGGAVVFNDGSGEKIWVVGGYTSSGAVSDAWYSADGAFWEQASADGGFPGRYAYSLNSFNGKIWLINGTTESAGTMDDIWTSTDGVNWIQPYASPPFPKRSFHRSVVLGGNLYVLCGTDVNDSINQIYATSGSEWTYVGDISPGNSRYAADVFNGQIWIMGTNDNVTWSQ